MEAVKETIGAAAVEVIRAKGRAGATAAEVAAELRRRPHDFVASTPNVADRLRKYARRGALKVEYSTSREGDVNHPAETSERFFAP